jgi:hypothetical protein
MTSGDAPAKDKDNRLLVSSLGLKGGQCLEVEGIHRSLYIRQRFERGFILVSFG